jgi:hypothetical protein
MPSAKDECRVIDRVTVGIAKHQQLRPRPRGAIHRFDLRVLMTAPGRALRLRGRGTNIRVQVPVSQSRSGRARIAHGRLFWIVFLSILR